MKGAALRWWLLQRVARWCGLTVGVTATLNPGDIPLLVVLRRQNDPIAEKVLFQLAQPLANVAADLFTDGHATSSERTH